jgi:hypothetical protein
VNDELCGFSEVKRSGKTCGTVHFGVSADWYLLCVYGCAVEEFNLTEKEKKKSNSLVYSNIVSDYYVVDIRHLFLWKFRNWQICSLMPTELERVSRRYERLGERVSVSQHDQSISPWKTIKYHGATLMAYCFWWMLRGGNNHFNENRSVAMNDANLSFSLGDLNSIKTAQLVSIIEMVSLSF